MIVYPPRSVPKALVPAFGPVLAALCAGLAAAALPSPVLAQATVSVPVVQALPSRESLELSAALSRLGRDPSNIDALVDAGNAASDIGDFDAAIGFFNRGQQLSPNNPRLLAGLAGALAHHGDPVGAIKLFTRAEAAGAKLQDIAADRGLAYDLAGDTASAQRYYEMALANGGDDEVRRRLAISYAIGGDAAGSDKILMPLLQKQDKAAWRARAFALAIQGQSKEAIKITKTLLPARLADNISPYMQYMPRLTSAQQAAAANLGIFPRASDIGRDGTAIASFSTATADSTHVAAVDRALVPAGAPLGAATAATKAAPTDKSRRAEREAQQAEAKRAERDARAAKQAARDAQRVAPPEPQPARQAGSADEPAFAVATLPSVPPVSGILSGTAAPEPVVQKPVTQAAPRSEQAAAPGFDLRQLPTAAPAATSLATVQPTQPRPSFSELFRDLERPAASATPALGAVDIRKIEPARPQPKVAQKAEEKPAAKPAPPPPSHPSRIWVQLGIGQKLSALAYDWRRLERSNPQVFAKQKPFSAKLNQTNRLLTGPFASQKEANGFIADLHKAGIDGPYIWTSPAGEVVDGLAR